MRPVTLACGPYDRTEALRSGDVRVEGVALNYLTIDNPREIFDRMVVRREFDASELSISEFIVMASEGNSPFVGLPVFVSRVFRHGFIYVNRRKGIASPRDLEGRRVGVPLYTQTAAVWARAHLAEQFGVDLSRISWVQGALEHAGSHGVPREVKLVRPARIEQNHSGRSLEAMLAEGEIDALVCARAPKAHPDIARLLPDYVELEKEHYRATRVFPIMHMIALRRAVHEEAPWLASSLYKAFCEAGDWAWMHLNRFAAPRTMLPWAVAEIEELNQRYGGNPWPCGVEANRPTLDALMRAMVAQDLIAAPLPIDGLFLPV